MTGDRLEVPIDKSLAGRLLAAQFPQWADLPLELVDSTGTDNAIFRLCQEMVVRFPRFHSAADHAEKEQQWLPLFAPYVSLPIPVPLGKGTPTADYPWHWSVYRWLEGETPVEHKVDMHQAATAIGQFITSLQRIEFHWWAIKWSTK